MDFKARDGRSVNTHYCTCSDICTASPYPAYDIYKNTESASVCPDGFEDSVVDVTDGIFNVKTKGVSTIEACGKLCKNKCTMFEYKASKKQCKISTGALGIAFQIKKWQSCTKGVSLCLCLHVFLQPVLFVYLSTHVCSTEGEEPLTNTICAAATSATSLAATSIAATKATTTKKLHCQVCKSGKFQPVGEDRCDLCPAGTYAENPGTAHNCMTCPEGRTSGKGFTECSYLSGTYYIQVLCMPRV